MIPSQTVMPSHMTRHAASRGFTLIEVLVAMLLTALVMTSVMGVLHDAINSRDHIHNISQIQRTGPMILDMIEADLRAIAPFDVAGRKVFLGKKNSIRGADADTMDFVVQRPASVDTIFRTESPNPTAPSRRRFARVGYHLRQNKREPVFMELCRREDPLVDDDPYKGGTYTKIYDKITNLRSRTSPRRARRRARRILGFVRSARCFRSAFKSTSSSRSSRAWKATIGSKI